MCYSAEGNGSPGARKRSCGLHGAASGVHPEPRARAANKHVRSGKVEAHSPVLDIAENTYLSGLILDVEGVCVLCEGVRVGVLL